MLSRPTVLFGLPVAHAIGCGGDSISQAQFERVKIGMTSQEVEGVLGKGGKEVPADEVAALMRDALAPKGGSAVPFELSR